MRWRRWRSTVALAAIMTARTVGVAAADDSLNIARELYAQAAYEDALAMLNRLRAPNGDSPEDRSIEQYRALCLLALGRATEAQRAIEVVVAAEPSFQPSAAEVSPRVRSAFSDVRRRMLPTIIQQKYALAKGAFERKEYAVAADGFGQVGAMLSDRDVGAAANQPPLADLRMLAAGFRDLSVNAAAPPPVVAAPPPAPPPPAAPEPRILLAPRVYSAEDTSVVPPTVVRQALPPFPSRSLTASQGALAVIVDERGLVEGAMMLIPLGQAYDRMVLDSAKQWRYRPATLNGVPVKFRRIVQINVAPPTPNR